MRVKAAAARAVAVLVAAVATLGCPSADGHGVAAARPDAGAVAAAVLPDPESVAPAGDAGAVSGTATIAPRPLPSPARLLAPFRGTNARGFVAFASTDGALPREARRSVVDLAGGTADGKKPVLVASFTKLFTAVATLRMVARGELSLDATVKESLPALAPRPWASSTIRELLTHTSLVPELDDKGGFYRKSDVDFSSPTAVLAGAIPRDWTEKRGIYKYRNSELALVGAILAERSKTSADRVLAREVFEPAGMTHAGLLVGRGPAELDLRPMGPIRPQNFFTAGAGYASAEDLLAFFEALAGTDLLDAASKALLFDGVATRGNGGAIGCWAYPFARPDGGTTLLVERPGSFGNVRLFAAFFPEEKRVIVAYSGDGTDIPRPRTGRGIGHALALAALE